ncbi:MAG: D-alanine--D-alanine ligase [Ruminococcaceae bacterium]|nr:D-alanine--D-alanine ligase [Oscillospiraceae bacterium]
MEKNREIKVAVMFGGQSTEHEVSCLSAYSVIKNIDREKFNIELIGITKDGDWVHLAESDIKTVKDCSWAEKAVKGAGISGAIKVLESCDVVFPVLHGLWGEDGTVQGIFELLGIPYVGCGVLASAVSMDKAYTKIILKDAGIPQCIHTVAYRQDILQNISVCIEEIESKIGYPCFIKPSNSGSSVGVFKVKNRDELKTALIEAQKFDRKVIVEEFVDGREIECAVLGNENPVASTPGEIIPSKEFYDYEDKYSSGASVVQIPADIPEEKREEIKKYAVKAFKAIDCAGLSRVDFFYKRSNGEIVLNEINTLPGFTDISMYSKMIKNDGMDFKTLITELIELAFDNKENNRRCGV